MFVCVRSVTLTFETFNITPYKTLEQHRYAKLVYLLSLDISSEQIKRLFVRSLRGEVLDDTRIKERRSSRTKSGQLSPSVSVRGLRKKLVRLVDDNHK